ESYGGLHGERPQELEPVVLSGHGVPVERLQHSLQPALRYQGHRQVTPEGLLTLAVDGVYTCSSQRFARQHHGLALQRGPARWAFSEADPQRPGAGARDPPARTETQDPLYLVVQE